MAGFKAHITTSSLVGIGYAVGAHVGFGFPISSCVLAGGLCSVAGMLPDLDSDSGRPLRESMAFAAAVVPMMLMRRFEGLGLNAEQIVLAGAGLYLLIRFGFSALLQKFTVHRGMFHSLPAAIIAGEIIFLLSPETDLRLRIFKASAVVLGYVSHLILDEFASIDASRGIRIKKSFGTALKVFGSGWLVNGFVYANLLLLGFLVVNEPSWMERFRATPIAQSKEAVEGSATGSGEAPAAFSAEKENRTDLPDAVGALRDRVEGLFR